MRKLVSFVLLLGMSFTNLANASVASFEETIIMQGCNKSEKKEQKQGCCKKGKSCKKSKAKKKKEQKRNCCKTRKSCKKKEDKKIK